jgi:hypothetical protein
MNVCRSLVGRCTNGGKQTAKSFSRKVLQLALSCLNSGQQMSRRKHSLRKKDAAFIGLWVPKHWVPALDSHARRVGSDRSKILRLALAKHAGLN